MLHRLLITGAFIFTFFAPGVLADTVLANRTIRAQSVIGPDDIRVVPGTTPGGISDPNEVIGKEARTNIYAGRAVRLADVGAPALVKRNQIVTILYRTGPLSIIAEGRALDRGAVGERLRVLNLSSRKTVSGVVNNTGAIIVGQTRGLN